jgi:hypothetical protein
MSVVALVTKRALGINTRPVRVPRNCMDLGLKSSPSFREKLAEREESILLSMLLLHKDFLGSTNLLYQQNGGFIGRLSAPPPTRGHGFPHPVSLENSATGFALVPFRAVMELGTTPTAYNSTNAPPWLAQ